MKKQPGFRWAVGILALMAALTVTVLAASYDSSEDPIISLSYLTDVFRPSIVKDYEEKIAELEARINSLEAGGRTPSQTPPETESETEPETEPETESAEPETKPEPVPAADTTYEVIEMKYGDCLFAAGPIDIMLRAGSAICIAPDATQGISDYTEGKEIYNGEGLTKNHMCLIPRGDGRGIMATAQSVYIMVRGEYSLVES